MDRRVLDLLMPGLGRLIVLDELGNAAGSDLTVFERVAQRRDYDPDLDGYIWEDDPLCGD